MKAEDVRIALARRWPDDRYLHVYEAPTDSARQGIKIDVLVMSLWQTDRHELDAVEIKVSYGDWCREWRKVDWFIVDHLGARHQYTMKPNDRQVAHWTSAADHWVWKRHHQEPPPDDFVPTVERVESVCTNKSHPWRQRAHRFWVAAPHELAKRIAADVERLELGWGVLGVTETASFVLATPVKNKTPTPFSHPQWLGIVRAAADSGFQALSRARDAGYREGCAVANSR